MPISIVVPVYNEEKILEKNAKQLLAFLRKLRVDFELLIISNGSTDGTVKIGRRLERENKEVRFYHINQRGVGLAFKLALKKARYENLICLDIDMSTELAFIKRAYDLLKKGISMVIGSKVLGVQVRSTLRRFMSRSFLFLIRAMLGMKYSDYSIGAKGYKRSEVLKYERLIDKGSFYVIAICYELVKEGKRIVEIPVRCVDIRKSRFNLLGEALYRFLALLKFWTKTKLLQSS